MAGFDSFGRLDQRAAAVWREFGDALADDLVELMVDDLGWTPPEDDGCSVKCGSVPGRSGAE